MTAPVKTEPTRPTEIERLFQDYSQLIQSGSSESAVLDARKKLQRAWERIDKK